MSKLVVRATFAFKSRHRDKVLLNDVYVDGDVFRDHTWVDYHDDMEDIQSGDILTFRATYHTFVGLNKVNEYVQKKGFKNIKNLILVRP